MSKLPIYLAAVIIIIAGLLLWQFDLGTELSPPVGDSDVIVIEGEAAEELASSIWVWQETIMSNGDETTPNNTDTFTLDFSLDGSVSGTTDCNSFNGSYQLNETEISFGDMTMTRMYCEGSQEQEFIDMVTRSNSIYFDENGDLALLLPYDSGSVIFAAE